MAQNLHDQSNSMNEINNTTTRHHRSFPPLYVSSGDVNIDRLAFFHILERLKVRFFFSIILKQLTIWCRLRNALDGYITMCVCILSKFWIRISSNDFFYDLVDCESGKVWVAIFGNKKATQRQWLSILCNQTVFPIICTECQSWLYVLRIRTLTPQSLMMSFTSHNAYLISPDIQMCINVRSPRSGWSSRCVCNKMYLMLKYLPCKN